MGLCPLPIKSNNYYNDVLQANKLLLFVVKISILLNDHSVLVVTNFWPQLMSTQYLLPYRLRAVPLFL